MVTTATTTNRGKKHLAAPRNKLIMVLGPTGSGKTELAIRLARKLGTCIISTDSRQIYRGMAIGTAQPNAEQMNLVEHHMIANHDITEHFTCGNYEREAMEVLHKLFENHDTVVAAGGSGLYIDALCHGMDEMPRADPQLRELIERQWREERQSLLEELQRADPGYFDIVDRDNPQRVIRAIEICRTSGRPYSSFRTGRKLRRDFDIIKIGIDMPRSALYRRIDSRVDEMIERGLEQEAAALYPLRELNSLQTVGYRELFDYFDGLISRDEAIELIKRNSRRYAKRQMTWFLRDKSIKWFEAEQMDGAEEYIANVCR